MTRFNITRSKKLRLILLCIIFFAFGGMIWIYLNAGNQNAPKENKPLLSFPKASLSIGKIQHTATRNGKTEWALEASSGQYLDDKNKVIIKDLMIVFYLDGIDTAQIKAEEGILFTQTNDIQISGNVLLKNQGYRLNTQKINYNHEKRIVNSEAPITIENEFLFLTADRLELNLNENKTTLSGHVKGLLGETINE